MSAPLLALRNVTFGYDPGSPVLRAAALDIHPGDRLALTGRNGAGKSTLLQLLVGLLRPQSGQVEFQGRVSHGEKDFVALRRRVGLLFQNADDQLFCPTVMEDVAFGPLNLGMAPDQARCESLRALQLLGLTAYADRITHRLSVGEKKLVALAGLLAMNPAVLLLDEPTAGLDAEARDRVVAVLNTQQVALLVVAQDPEFLAAVTRTGLQLHDGTITPGG